VWYGTARVCDKGARQGYAGTIMCIVYTHTKVRMEEGGKGEEKREINERKKKAGGF